MTPRKAKQLIPEVAKDLNLPQSLVTDVVDFFFRELRDTMASMEDTHIAVPDLGVFRSRPKMMKASITKFELMMSRVDPQTIRGMKIHQDLQRKIDKIKHNLTLWDVEFGRKQQVKEKRYGRIIPSMEKQGEDLRGNEEQPIQDSGG